jgi:hypothetical protein
VRGEDKIHLTCGLVIVKKDLFVLKKCENCFFQKLRGMLSLRKAEYGAALVNSSACIGMIASKPKEP